MSAGETAQVITACAAVGAMLVSAVGLVVSVLNRRNISEIHRTTNSLAARNEAIAKSLGISEGKAQGLQQGRDEGKHDQI